MKILRTIKQLIPERLKREVLLFFESSNNPYWLDLYKREKKNIFIFLAGFYQNLGDMALTYSQKKFLQRIFPDANIITIPSTSTYSSIKTLRKVISSDDLITIIGGGNMDDMYVSLEEARLHVVKSFPKNRIISFPQTMAFSETSYGVKRREISYKIYSKHKNLTLFFREKNSLERVKKYWPNLHVGYCPDIVLSLNETKSENQRNNILCCFRHDKEMILNNQKSEAIINRIKNIFPNLQITDTVNISIEECQPHTYEQTLKSFWNCLQTCKCVLTDRLHCMIFCVITGTPCIVMDNSNHKISGVYNEWLKDIQFIKFINQDLNVDTIVNIVINKMKDEIIAFDLKKINDKFLPLREECYK